MDYKEQIEQAKHAAVKWREEHPIVGVGELRVDCMVDDLCRSITELLSRADATEARAEKAEREKDVATNRMKDIISGNIYPCEVCKHRWEGALFKPQRKCDYFEYGKKEE